MQAVNRAGEFVLLAALALTLGGCVAPTQRLSDADRARVREVRINGTVDKVAVPFLLAPGNAGGLMFGAAGGAASAGGIEDSRNAFVVFLEKNAISIGDIVREEIEQALRESGKVAIAAPGTASVPTINITVQQYGFGVPHLVSSNVVPVLTIKCDMVDGSGKLLWSASDRMGPSIANPIDSTPWNDLKERPKLIEELWRKASRHLARQIVTEL